MQLYPNLSFFFEEGYFKIPLSGPYILARAEPGKAVRLCQRRVQLLPSSCTAFYRPTQSIRFGDLGEANGRGKPRQKHDARALVLLSKWRTFLGFMKCCKKATIKTLRLIFALTCELISSEHVAEIVALKTFGDGNCCFKAVSLMLFGNEEHRLQPRVRTIL